MTAPPVVLRRYRLPSTKSGEGWAIIVLGSDGFFSAVSDFDNYAFLWSAHGQPDFRLFLLEAETDDDYFIRKLSPGKVYDGDESEKNIRRAIVGARRDGLIRKEAARRTWRELSDYNFHFEAEFYRWYYDDMVVTALEPESLMATRQPHMVTRFVRETMPRLCVLLRAELEAEGIL